MTTEDLLVFLRFVAGSDVHRHLLAQDVQHIDFDCLHALAARHNLDVPIEELRRAVRQFKRIADSPFVPPEAGLL